MKSQSSRRGFLKDMSARAATLVGLGACSRFLSSSAPETLWDGVPPLDGSLLLDEGSRELMRVDFGANFRRIPAAVLRPRSPQDVMRIVQFANGCCT